jgi:hypothetical protein
MQLKTVFKVSAVAVALVLAGCGGDIKITPTVNDTSVNNSNNTTNNSGGSTGGNGGTGTTNPCTKRGDVQGAYDGKDCSYTAAFASKNVTITDNLTFKELPNGGVHVFSGALLIGTDCNTTTGCTINASGPTLTVEPGANMAFTSGESIIRIARGAKIIANGTFAKPITFTSANAYPRLDVVGDGPQFADWGGIIINGFGKTDQCTDAQRKGTQDPKAGACNVASEGIVSYYGGKDNADNSGSIKYAKIWYAGSGPKVGGDGDDLNSLTLNAVGSGSSFEFLHIHQGYDDGIEFFGGAANIKNIVVTDTQDDAIDVDASWQGKGQYIMVRHGTVDTKKDVTDGTTVIKKGQKIFMGNAGFEIDGRKSNGSADYSDTLPSSPNFANVTVITTDGKSVRDNFPSLAITFDDQFAGSFYNTLLVKKEGKNSQCINFKPTGQLQADKIKMFGSVMACDANFSQAGGVFSTGPLNTTAMSVWFENSGASQILNALGDALAADGYSTNTTPSTKITIKPNDLKTLDAFYDPAGAAFIGALSDKDTTSEWAKWVKEAVTAADKD